MKIRIAPYLTAVALLWTLNSRAGVLPPDSIVGGKTIGDWSVAWWQWALALPVAESPFLDQTGSSANVGQPDGNVFFLGGHSGLADATFHRTFTIPEGKYLLMPVLVAQIDNIDSEPLSVHELTGLLVDFMDAPRELHASIDGVAVPDLEMDRALSPVFSFSLDNPDNFKTYAQGHAVTGVVSPAISDGYWLMIEPLSQGTHQLRYGGAYRLPFFYTNNVIADITVIEAPLPERLQNLLRKLDGSLAQSTQRRALTASLEAALQSLSKGNSRAALQQLNALKNKITAQVAPARPEWATEVLGDLEEILQKAASQPK